MRVFISVLDRTKETPRLVSKQVVYLPDTFVEKDMEGAKELIAKMKKTIYTWALQQKFNVEVYTDQWRAAQLRAKADAIEALSREILS